MTMPSHRARRPIRMLAAACLAIAGAGAAGAQELERQPPFPLPPSGMGATAQGGRVVLLPNGTWRIDSRVATQHVTAITDDGHYIHLLSETDTEGGVVRRWNYTGAGGGPIQVLITRATAVSANYDKDPTNCVPVIAVRNLTLAELDHVVVEIQFEDGSGLRDTMSAMLGPFNHGDELQQLGAALDMRTCHGIEGKVHIVSCRFTNGVPCQHVTRASAFGVIPLRMADVETADMPTE